MLRRVAQRTQSDCVICVLAMVMGWPYSYERVLRDSEKYLKEVDGKFLGWWDYYLADEGFQIVLRPFSDLYELPRFAGKVVGLLNLSFPHLQQGHIVAVDEMGVVDPADGSPDHINIARYVRDRTAQGARFDASFLAVRRPPFRMLRRLIANIATLFSRLVEWGRQRNRSNGRKLKSARAQRLQMDDLSRLLTHELIGTYTHFEATEIFACREKGAEAENVLTVLVAEDREAETPVPPDYLTGRIKVDGLDGWIFGIKRYTAPIADLLALLAKLEATNVWEGAKEPLKFGALHRAPAQFIPPDSTTLVPWNRVLKNNFWNGSHVVEWSDREKGALASLLDAPYLLEELSRQVALKVPINLAGLSDRLGNLIVQLPVFSLITKFEPLRTGSCTVKVAWRPNVKPRPLRAACFFDFDGTIGGFAAGPVSEPETVLAAENARGMHHGFLWDDESGVLLAAAGPTGFIESIGLSVALNGGKHRTFRYTDAKGASQELAVPTSRPGITSIIGRKDRDETEGRARKRIQQQEKAASRHGKEFFQFDPAAKGQAEEQQRAFDVIKTLIGDFGQEGTCLWDPYLTSYDVIKTLLGSKHVGTELRALTAANVPPPSSNLGSEEQQPSNKHDFIEAQRRILEKVEGSWAGIHLEFRASWGPSSWPFHDRFLIFPRKDNEPLAWSLGTSINGLGNAFHVFQQVSDGRQVMEAFDRLWNGLSEPDHLIWRKP
jgi:hypothetical protein